jgi:hypothetical protein
LVLLLLLLLLLEQLGIGPTVDVGQTADGTGGLGWELTEFWLGLKCLGGWDWLVTSW